jgi:hypothetical protein
VIEPGGRAAWGRKTRFTFSSHGRVGRGRGVWCVAHSTALLAAMVLCWVQLMALKRRKQARVGT